MNPKLILHIPHSSICIPSYDGYVVDKESLNSEMLKLTDWFTNELFESADDEMIIADFSRIFCDPERFDDDNKEEMAKFGMGVLYEKTDNGEPLRIVSPELRAYILNNYFYKHHEKLNNAVNEQLKKNRKALIIDCHSFSSQPFKRDLDQQLNRPDINIGTDDVHTPEPILNAAVAFFEKAGYSIEINRPYKGTIVPIEHYGKNHNVSSIMLEINRKLYLKEPDNIKSETFLDIKSMTKEFIEVIRKSFL